MQLDDDYRKGVDSRGVALKEFFFSPLDVKLEQIWFGSDTVPGHQVSQRDRGNAVHGLLAAIGRRPVTPLAFAGVIKADLPALSGNRRSNTLDREPLRIF